MLSCSCCGRDPGGHDEAEAVRRAQDAGHPIRLTYMEQLNRLDTTDVEPLSQMTSMENVFRDDLRTPGIPREEALRNAPARTEEFFKVPRVPGGR